jgi:TIR domain
MSGINRASSSQRLFSESRKSRGIICVFLSHQQKDKEISKKIADYFMNADVDVYFDEYDDDLRIYREENDPKGVTNSIRKGINNSSHMLCLISLNSLSSKWVPWEIGYGYDKTDVSVLTTTGIKDEDLPQYLQTVQVLRGTKSLNRYLSSITGKTESVMENNDLIKSHNTFRHPLGTYLDQNK